MSEAKFRLAIFDFDGTLTEGHLWKGIAKHHRAKKLKRWTLLTYFAWHIPFWLASNIKLYNKEKNRSKWGEDLAVLFKGMTLEKTKEIFEWVADNYFLPLLRKDIVELLNEHKKQGYKIVLLSGMFIEFLEVMRTKIGADYVQGTKLEFLNEVCSGKIIQPLCFGRYKAVLLEDLIIKNRLNVDLCKSSAFADSYYDLPVFEMVGNPVATYPDKKLHQIARVNQWKVISSG
jgi:HAD superfamily hydrolase (TIGR01490 family)